MFGFEGEESDRRNRRTNGWLLTKGAKVLEQEELYPQSGTLAAVANS
jgi:hypothetical protein